MTPPKKKSKTDPNHVEEISEIFRNDSRASSTEIFGSHNRLISSTPSTSTYDIHSVLTDNRVSTSSSSYHSSESPRSISTSRDVSPATRKRSLEETFTTTAHLEGARSLFTGYTPCYPSDCLQKGSRFNLDTFLNNSSAKKLKEVQSSSNARKSPFYMGQTMFGGASSAAYLAATEKLTASLRQIPKDPNLKPAIRIEPIVINAQDSNTNQMSQTARRILSTLEQFAKPFTGSSPRANTSPTPTLVQNAKRFGSLDRSLNRSRDSNDQSPILANKPYARSPVFRSSNTCFQKELQVATVPELLKLLHKNQLQKSTLAARKVATTSNSDLMKPDTTYKLRVDDNDKMDNKSITKVKTKISSVRANKTNLDLEEPAPSLDLPSVQLNITTMPKFDIQLPTKIDASVNKLKPTVPAIFDKDSISSTFTFISSSSTVPSTASSIVAPSTTSAPAFIGASVTSAAPVSVPNVTASTTKLVPQYAIDKSLPTQFKFSFPAYFSMISKLNIKGQDNNSYKFHSPDKINSTSDSLIKCDDTNKYEFIKMVNNKNYWECKVCYAKNYSNITQCILCGEHVKGNEKRIHASSLKSSQSSEKKKFEAWECKECSHKNSIDQNKCRSCGILKDAIKYPSINFKFSSSDSYQGLLNEQNKKWECIQCLTRNDAEKVKCVCCEKSKPDMPPINDAQAPLSNSFESLVKKQNEKWECVQCFTRNEYQQNKCICCTAAKSDGINKSVTTSNTFQDVLKQQNQKWECSQCLTRNETEKIKCACCEAPRTGCAIHSTSIMKKTNVTTNSFEDLLKKQNAKWECGQCLTRNESEVTKCACCNASRSGVDNQASLKNVFTLGKNNLSSSFQDIVKKQNQKWECNGCMTRNDQHKTKCACCEAPKPGTVQEKNQFNFSSVPITEFKFGIDKASDGVTKTPVSTGATIDSMFKASTSDATSNTSQTFSFGMPATVKPNELKTEKSEVVESKPATVNTTPATTNTAFVFGMPQSTNLSTEPKVTSSSTSVSGDTVFQFGKTSKEPDNTVPPVSIGFGILPSSKSQANNNISNITITNTSSANVTTVTSSSNSLFSFGSSTSSSSAFNGGVGSNFKKSEDSTKITTPTLKPLQTESSLFKIADKQPDQANQDNGNPSPKKTCFVFSPNVSTTATFGSSSKSTFAAPELKVSKDTGFQFPSDALSNTANQKPAFSFTSNTTTDKPGVFVFGNSGRNENNASSSPFVFGAPTQQQNQTSMGFGNNKPNNFSSNQTSTFVNPSSTLFASQPATNTASNNIFGANSTSSTNSSIFSFGSNTSQPAAAGSPAMFSFGSNVKSTAAPTTAGGFKFDLGSSAPASTSAQPAANSLNFGTDLKTFPAVQFQIGAAPSEGRRIKKAVRRGPR